MGEVGGAIGDRHTSEALLVLLVRHFLRLHSDVRGAVTYAQDQRFGR